MDENNSDLYERQLFAVFESCLTKGKNELEENDLSSICNKLHLDELIEELKLCISKRPDKQTISFQEFRDGLLHLLKNFQGLINDRQSIVQPHYNLNKYDADVKKNKMSTSINMSKIYLQGGETNITMDESRLIRLWEKIQIYLRDHADSTAIQFISGCIGIPELPKQITESMFERLDQDCDGLISFDEFVIIFQKRKDMEALRKHNECQSGIVNCNVNTLDFKLYELCGINSVQSDKSIDEEEAAGVSNVSILPSRDLNTLDISFAEITDIICDELKSLNESLHNDSIQAYINLLRKMLILYQEEQRNLGVLMEKTKAEKEKMRIDMLEANERANLLTQEIEEYQTQLEKTKENLQKQNQQRYAEITKELSNQFNIEREIDAAALKSKDDQLQTLQKENHDMKNKLANVLQDNQMLEAENGTLLDQTEKLKQSNNDLLSRIKMLDAEHDEIQSMEAKQQEQVDFFVDRIKKLQSEITLLRDQNDELNAELETSKCHGNDTAHDETPSSLAYDLQLHGNREENHITTTKTFEVQRQVDSKISLDLEFSRDEKQLDISNSNAADLEKFRNIIIKSLDKMLSTNAKCTLDKCILNDAISRLIIDLRSNLSLNYLARDFEECAASEIETECDERAHESLRDLVVSKTSKSVSTRRMPILNSTENLDGLSGQDIKSAIQNKTTSLRDYPPRKEENSAEQYKMKEKDSSINIIEIENASNSVSTNAELQNIEAKYTTEKKQLIERCSELERSLDLLRAEYEECEDYWAAKLEEERQLFEQEQKISDDKLAELINKIAEYEELISPLDKSKNNGRLSPIDEKFNLEQQYIDLEEEFEKWKMKNENDISQKNIEIENLQEKLRLIEQRVTNDSWTQVPDEISLSGLSHVSFLSHCNSSSASSIPSTNDPIANIDQSDTNDQVYHTSKFTPSNDASRLMRQKDQTDGCNMCDRREKCSTKEIKKNPRVRTHKKNSHDAMTKEEKCNTDFWMQDVLMRNLKTINYYRAHNNAQHHACCVDPSILQNLNMKLYTQERKKRQLQHHFQQQQQQLEKILHRIMAQHQTELYHLQCLLRDTQKKLDMQIQTTINQADKLANADMLVKDLYIENACLMEHIKHLQERCLILSGLNAETTSM